MISAGAPPQTQLGELIQRSQTPRWNKGDLLLREENREGREERARREKRKERGGEEWKRKGRSGGKRKGE